MAQKSLGFQIVNRESAAAVHHGGGALLGFTSDDSLDVIDHDSNPRAILEAAEESLESLLDMPEGETVSLDGVEALKRFYEAISADMRCHNARAARSVVTRILAIGHRSGALREFALEDIGAVFGHSRQNICQSSNKADELLGGQFKPTRKGPSSRRKTDTADQ